MAFSSNNRLSLFLGLLSFVVIIPTLQANIAEYDDFWKERRLQAIENLNNSYHPNPEEVTKQFNELVGRTLMRLDNTRRDLTENKEQGECKASNPIDECWRCDPEWEKNRKKLADCAIGFGRGTTGGKDGEIYVVKDNSDDPASPKPGTLRYAVIQKAPLWIIFEKDMVIELKQELVSQSDKTIDGRGADVQIANGAGINIHFAKNIIISNIKIHDIKANNGGNIADAPDHLAHRGKSDGDGIHIFGGTNIWLDHLSLSRGPDGLIDATNGSTAITVSNCHFTDHDKVMLFGASDDCKFDEKMQITVAFNHFGKGCIQRMPRVRSGFFHVVNNHYTHWVVHAIGGGNGCTIISQGNRFANTADCKEVTKRDCANDEWKKWSWVSEGDVFENGAFFTPSGDPNASKKFGADQMLSFLPGEQVPELTKNAGTLKCTPGKGC